MQAHSQKFILIALFVLAVVSFESVSQLQHQERKIQLTAAIEENITPEKPFHLDERTKETDCQLRGNLPDHACTPGAVFLEATVKEICVKGYTKTVRSVSTSLKKKVYAEYGIPYPQPRGTYEADHLIPLELGGNNDIANLFPESAEPRPGFREKDLVENYLNHEVCGGRLSLQAAQEQIANDWTLVYNNLTPDQVQELKLEFTQY